MHTVREGRVVVCQAPPSTEYSIVATPEVASVAETETPTLEVYQPASPLVPVRTGALMTGGVLSMWIVWLILVTFPALSVTFP